MKINKLICLVIFGLFLMGCSSISVELDTTAIAQNTVLPTETRTPLPTATNTVLPNQTPTPILTLPPEQADKLLQELLWKNPECFAPCFMGVTPGETTLEETNLLFTPLDPWYSCELDDSHTGQCSTSHRFATDLSIYIWLSIKSGIVENLQIPITLPANQSPAARSEWSAFSPENLIRQYGLPSKVNIFADLGPTPTYAIDMYFDAHDMIYSYWSYDFGVNLRVCPNSDHFEGISIWMGKNPINPPLETVPLEKATTMTREEFAKLLTSDTNGVCFLLNKAAFP
jgi:hypothetical protein